VITHFMKQAAFASSMVQGGGKRRDDWAIEANYGATIRVFRSAARNVALLSPLTITMRIAPISCPYDFGSQKALAEALLFPTIQASAARAFRWQEPRRGPVN
jgi:hypothetical protein